MVKGVIAVLGSFDTWSYIDYVSRVVAKNGYIARTSRYEYAFDEQLRRVIRVVFHPAPGETMIHFLKDTVIGMSDAAIVIYSVPAGHYNEVHWCAELKKETLGIAFVRDVEEKNYKTGRSCSELSVSHDKTFSVCKGGIMKPAWTGWDCVRSDPCPFKKQGISINQLEYFHQNHSFMHLFAVEEIQNVDKIISDFLNGTLKCP